MECTSSAFMVEQPKMTRSLCSSIKWRHCWGYFVPVLVFGEEGQVIAFVISLFLCHFISYPLNQTIPVTICTTCSPALLLFVGYLKVPSWPPIYSPSTCYHFPLYIYCVYSDDTQLYVTLQAGSTAVSHISPFSRNQKLDVSLHSKAQKL